jgi:hypothetical protein
MRLVRQEPRELLGVPRVAREVIVDARIPPFFALEEEPRDDLFERTPARRLGPGG